MDLFLYDSGLRHERVKVSIFVNIPDLLFVKSTQKNKPE